MDAEEQARQIASLDYEDQKAEVAERLRFQSELAHAALRGLTLTNGGAVVALFTFIGNSAAAFDRTMVWWAFGLFLGGLFCTLSATVAGYFAQGSYMQATQFDAWTSQSRMVGGSDRWPAERTRKVGWIVEVVGVTAALLALLAFGAGSWCALAGVLAG